jgi:hypothetical protein
VVKLLWYLRVTVVWGEGDVLLLMHDEANGRRTRQINLFSYCSTGDTTPFVPSDRGNQMYCEHGRGIILVNLINVTCNNFKM